MTDYEKLTLTYDQGREMAEHLGLTKTSKVKVYFAHKGCPWERGTNENFNGLWSSFFSRVQTLTKCLIMK